MVGSGLARLTAVLKIKNDHRPKFYLRNFGSMKLIRLEEVARWVIALIALISLLATCIEIISREIERILR